MKLTDDLPTRIENARPEDVRCCERCDTLVNHRHGNLCAACIAEDMDWDEIDERDGEGPAFDCAGYYPEPAGDFYCPLWGTEECDWECPHGGMR